MLLLAAGAEGNAAFAGPADGRSPGRGDSRARGGGRYISAQAYHHAMRAELALSAGQPERAIEELKLARVYDQESLYLTLRLGAALLSARRLDRAERLVGEAKKLAPSAPEALRFEAQVALARGANQVAESTLKRVVDRHPGDLEAVTLYADLLLGQRRLPEAAKVLRRAAERAPQAVEPLLGLAKVELERNAFAAAALALERAAGRDERRGDVIAALAEVYHRLDRDEEAVDRLRAVIEVSPQDERALLAAARAELWVGQDERAARWLARLERQGDRGAGARRAGMLYAQEGRYERAVPLLVRALSAQPSDTEVRFELVRSYRALGTLPEALAALELISADDPRHLEARAEAAAILMEQGRAERAELALQPALAVAPADPRLIATWLAVRQARGRGAEALTQVPTAARADPLVLLAEGRTCWALGQLEEAATRLSAAGTAEALVALSELELQRGRGDLAVESLRRAEKRWPASALAKASLATHLAHKGEALTDAERLSAEALALDPASPTALAARGVVAVKRGEREAADRYWERARRLAPRDPRIAGLGRAVSEGGPVGK